MNIATIERPQVDVASFDSIMINGGMNPETFDAPQKAAFDIGSIAVSVVAYGEGANFGIAGFNTVAGTEVARGTVSNIASKYDAYVAAKQASGATEAEYRSMFSDDEKED